MTRMTRGYKRAALGQIHYCLMEGDGEPLLMLPPSGQSSIAYAELIPKL